MRPLQLLSGLLSFKTQGLRALFTLKVVTLVLGVLEKHFNKPRITWVTRGSGTREFEVRDKGDKLFALGNFGTRSSYAMQ